LNIYASHDFSANREEVYREHFFRDCDYHAVDYWHDKFIPEGKTIEEVPHQQGHIIPYRDNYFDVLATTKAIMEHVSEPENVIREVRRILKPGGEAFVVAPLVRRQHQHPHDYFRYTEFGLEHLFRKSGFVEIKIAHSNGFIATAVAYAYFFQRGLRLRSR